jgi:hypothetical protein
LLGEAKFVNLMEKLNEEQSKFYADKKASEVKVKDLVEAAQRKVGLNTFHYYLLLP